MSSAAKAFEMPGATSARSRALFFRAVTCDLRNPTSVDRKCRVFWELAQKSGPVCRSFRVGSILDPRRCRWGGLSSLGRPWTGMGGINEINNNGAPDYGYGEEMTR